MRKELSSFLTIFYKFIFTSMVIGLGSLSFFTKDTCAIIAFLVTAFIIITLFGTLKHVEVDDSNIYISNYFKTISIPLSDIENVSDVLLLTVRRVTVEFKHESAFGYSIHFAPKYILGAPYEEHPVVTELKHLANL
jgi:hypothetical protein